ncbi:MAG: alginate lyase family protein, partial [candidate division Zixibacteria bacterium]|nr:alginate lyase family protein [candidate division Zixibacteria bacterium]
ELEKEIKAQTLSDGFCYESSMNYQTLTSEIYILAYVIGSRSVRFSQEYRDRLEAMLRLSQAFLKPDGTLPNFGDGDSGRILIFDGVDKPDPEKLLDIGALALNLPDLRTSTEKPPFDSLQLLGSNVLRPSERLRCGIEQPKVSQLCRESGLATLRKDDLYLFFGANPIGSGGVGGHKHNDMLTIDISCGKTNFIVDSGTYTYTSNSTIRNRFRSTGFHSVPAVKNIEQNRFIPRILFAIRPDADVKVKRWESNERYDIVEAEHSAYTRLPEPLLILRSIYFDKINDFWVFKDSFCGHGSFDFQSNLILGDVTAEIRDNDRIKLSSKFDDTVLEIISFSTGWSGEIIPHEISPHYGMKKEGAKITLSYNGKAPIDMIWAAIPSRAGQDTSDRTVAADRVTHELGWKEAECQEPISGLALSRDS